MQEAINLWKRREEGYSLIEMIFVLSLFMMLTALGAGLYPVFIRQMDTGAFASQLGDDLFYAQQYAASTQNSVTFQWDQANREYFAYSYSGGYLFERVFPEGVRFQGGTLGASLRFLPNGNGASAGTWLIYSGNITYKVTVNLGSGRFRIEKF